jgi:hypothetical protein
MGYNPKTEFKMRTIDFKGSRYLLKEDVASMIREATATQVTDDRRYFEQLAQNLEKL